MGLAKIGGVGISFEESGRGFPVVFLSGLGQGTPSWRAQARLFSKRYRVILYDIRGQGGSDRPEGSEAYRIIHHVDDLLGLLDYLQIDRAHLVGLSHGGMVAQWTALRAAERVGGLVLGSTLAYTTSLLRHIFLSWIRAGEAGGNLLRFDVTVPWLFSEDFLEKNGPLIETLRSLSARVPVDSLIHLLRNSLAHNLENEVAKILAPTLILCGELDLLTPYRHARFLHEQIRNSELVVIPGSGHVLPLEAPEAFNLAVGSFLQKLDAVPPLKSTSPDAIAPEN